MYQCSFTAHLVLLSRMYNYVCMPYALRTIGARGASGGKLGLQNPGECNQYAGQRVRMSCGINPENAGGLACMAYGVQQDVSSIYLQCAGFTPKSARGDRALKTTTFSHARTCYYPLLDRRVQNVQVIC